MEGGDAGDIAPHRRRRLERRHGIDEGGDGCRQGGECGFPSVAAPGGEDRHVGAQRPLGVAGIGPARRRRVALQIGQRAGLDLGRYRGLNLGEFGHWTALT